MIVRDLDTAEHHVIARTEPMNVEPIPHTDEFFI